MVVFSCGHCGESVQKPKVEKHYMTKCRNRNPNLSCMDCFKDFLGNDYEAHTKCITEEERYSGKGFMVKEKKGEKKQNAWVEILQSVLDEQKSAPGNVRRIIETISKHNNTPRKKPKFINFVKNVCGHKTNPQDMDQAWELISVKLSELSNVTQNSRNQNQKKNEPEPNGKTDVKEEANGDVENNEEKQENGDGEQKESNENVDKKLSKKQRKEEKKRKKYEAELQSAVAPPPETEEEETVTKKDKKKKNRNDSTSNTANGMDDGQSDDKNKQKKRKRQDTVNGLQETVEDHVEYIENEPVNKEKILKKKFKVASNEDIDESICLHDQNVAKIGELHVSNNKFDWHSVIISVLEKKGNELPFKRLQKKVLSEYSEATGQDIDDRIADKFIKKLRSAPNVKVDKNRVYLDE